MPKHRIHFLLERKMKVISRLSCIGVLALTISFARGQEVQHGTVVGVDVDEATGSITIRQPKTGTVGNDSPAGPPERYAIQDGLLFDALRVGEKVTFNSQEIRGVNTITQLQKE